MALDGFRLRMLTSFFFVLVMLGGILAGPLAFALLFGAVLAICLWEFLSAQISGADVPARTLRFFSLLAGLLPYLIVGLYRFEVLSGVPAAHLAMGFAPFLFLIFLLVLFGNRSDPFRDIGSAFIGILYIGLPFALMELIVLPSGGGYRMDLLLGLLFLNWTNDSGAYVVGSRIGRTPFFPRISPKKTWEGIAGAGVLTTAIALLNAVLFPAISLQEWLVLGLLVFVFGSLGDLVESMFKRSMQMKDSGSLLPGHGGFLDRFDGFIFHLPFTMAYLFLTA
ncbi:MAG: phosphatidate cytidylyltransferase [Haliscomenobacter sp.]